MTAIFQPRSTTVRVFDSVTPKRMLSKRRLLSQQAGWGSVHSSDEYVRLLLLQSNEELNTAIGKTETCKYMIVHPTCPLCWSSAFRSDQSNELKRVHSKAFAQQHLPLSEFLGTGKPNVRPQIPVSAILTSTIRADQSGDLMTTALQGPVIALHAQQQESEMYGQISLIPGLCRRPQVRMGAGGAWQAHRGRAELYRVEYRCIIYHPGRGSVACSTRYYRHHPGTPVS